LEDLLTGLVAESAWAVAVVESGSHHPDSLETPVIEPDDSVSGHPDLDS
jgi:hypothetical protein